MKRALDLVLSTAALPIALPIIGLGALAVFLDDPNPPFYVARRVGQHRRVFGLVKLRTMRRRSEHGPAITRPGDERTTRIGGLLRRWRLDEAPQLLNVILGNMSIVGPRPEDPLFLDAYSLADEAILAVRPGITGLAQLAFHDEGSLIDPRDPEGSYRAAVLPQKLAMDRCYVQRAGLLLDARVLWHTLRLLLFKQSPSTFVERVMRDV
jgi:lipopolysaccharide/colanic/teichoic acid biosynthesis glycosyltransferase